LKIYWVCRLLVVTPSSQPVRWREIHDIINERVPSGLCVYPFHCSQVMERCACSGRSCWSSFNDMLMSHLWKGEILRQYQLNVLGWKQKCVFENVPTTKNHQRDIFILLGFFWFFISLTITGHVPLRYKSLEIS